MGLETQEKKKIHGSEILVLFVKQVEYKHI
jgi:hypothetical protein